MQRFFFNGPPAKVGSVAHKLYGRQSRQYVLAEDFDRVLEERNALLDAVELYKAENRRLNWQLVWVGVMWYAALALAAFLAWRLYA